MCAQLSFPFPEFIVDRSVFYFELKADYSLFFSISEGLVVIKA